MIMKKNLRHRRSFSLCPLQKTLIMRFGLSYGMFLAVFFSVQSGWFSRLLGSSFVGPIGFDLFPLILPPLGIAFFLFVERKSLRSLRSLSWPSATGFMARCGLLLLIAGLATWITHPTPARWTIMDTFMNTYDPMAEPFVATGLYASLFLPLFPLLILFLPMVFLRRHIAAFFIGFFLLFFYIFVHPLEAFYHVATGSALLRLVGSILQMLPGETVLSPDRWEVTYRGFSVVLGPLCSGFTAMALFVAIFSVLWWQLSKHGGIYHSRAVLALVAGLIVFFFINILRIVLIMVIGSFSHVLGMLLFHGAAGSLFFFLVILFMIRIVVPLLRHGGHGGIRT